MRQLTNVVTETVCDSWEEFCSAILQRHDELSKEHSDSKLVIIDATNPHILAFGVSFGFYSEQTRDFSPVSVFYVLLPDVPANVRSVLNNVANRVDFWDALIADGDANEKGDDGSSSS